MNGSAYVVWDANGGSVACEVCARHLFFFFFKSAPNVTQAPVGPLSCFPSTSAASPPLFQVLPVSAATREVRGNRGYAANELVFEARAPPLGFTTYSVSQRESGPPLAPVKHRTPAAIQNKVNSGTTSAP